MAYRYETYDTVVIGAGHAGCEAALACARLGIKTIMFTVAMDSIALMPCNPNIGGTSKGHLVRELDALGGEMGKNIDKTFIQTRMLNESKGPAVHSLRAQADKQAYTAAMRKVVENTENLTLRQGEIAEVITNRSYIEEEWPEESFDREAPQFVIGVRTSANGIYPCKSVILCTGVYLKARCIYGDVENFCGPNGLPAANLLTANLEKIGIEMYRFKTGTPARIDKRSIDFSKMEEQKGDEKIVPFSFTNKPEDLEREQVSCWLTYTNEVTHEIIRSNIDRSPLYGGNIQGTGPRYCPSIEDKVVRFADKNRHQVFIEPEGEYTNEMYISGMSSSMPEDVQIRMYRSVPGLENAQIVRNAYAIEYDCINPMQLKPSLEFKDIEGFFSAGQANGSSGYEEAAAQGLIAGINCARKLTGKEPLILKRSDAYIGVLIDDLVTKETHEPYRMMTSRAEYRLLLRQDNADLRLTHYGYEVGLIDEERYQVFCEKKRLIEEEMRYLENTRVGATKKVQDFLVRYGSTPLNSGALLSDLIRRSELSYRAVIEEIDPRSERNEIDSHENISKVHFVPVDVEEQVEINLKYEGYIRRQMQQVEQFKKLENKLIPAELDYNDVLSLRLEARQKLIRFRPESVGQAARISGVSPADISVLLVYLEQLKRGR